MISKCPALILQLKRGHTITQLNYKTSDIIFPKLQAVGSWETTPLLKTTDMNRNESAKGDRGKGLLFFHGIVKQKSVS